MTAGPTVFYGGRATPLAEVLRVASDPAATAWPVECLPLRNLDVWAAVASRSRLSRAMRERLVDVAVAGNMDGARPGERAWEFRQRCALVHLAAPWLTTPRLARLVPAIAEAGHISAPGEVIQVVSLMLAQPAMTTPIAADALQRMFGWRAGMPEDVLEVMRAAAHPWPLLADAVDLYFPARGSGAPRPAGEFTMSVRKLGQYLDGVDEVAGSILLRILPEWRGSVSDAVDAARDVAGTTDPAKVVTRFGEILTAEERDHAYAFATGPDTTDAQLLVLPLRNLRIWEAVASRTTVSAPVRKALMDAVVKSPWRGPHRHLVAEEVAAAATTWARTILAPSWLTGARLAELADRSIRRGADPEVVIAAVLAHPRVNAHAVMETLRAAAWRQPGEGVAARWEPGLAFAEASAPEGTPWPSLVRLVRDFLAFAEAGGSYGAERRGEPCPGWKTQLPHPQNLGPYLDRLKLSPTQLQQLLETLPAHDGTLEDAIAAARAVRARPTVAHPAAAA